MKVNSVNCLWSVTEDIIFCNVFRAACAACFATRSRIKVRTHVPLPSDFALVLGTVTLSHVLARRDLLGVLWVELLHVGSSVGSGEDDACSGITSCSLRDLESNLPPLMKLRFSVVETAALQVRDGGWLLRNTSRRSGRKVGSAARVGADVLACAASSWRPRLLRSTRSCSRSTCEGEVPRSGP